MCNKGKILIIDDEKNIRQIIKEYLESEGFDVVEFESARFIIEAIKNEHPNLVIMDVALPGEDGFITAKKLRDDEETFLVPIIFISAQKKEYKDIREGFLAGASDYITKPFTKKELLGSIKKILSIKN